MECKFDTYLPMLLEKVGDKARVRAMFPGYLFVRYDPFACSLRDFYGSGFIGVVRFGSCPAVLDANDIATLREHENEDGLHELALAEMQAGSRAELLSGPFAGHTVVVIEDDLRLRYAVVSLGLTGRMRVARSALRQ